MTDNEKRMKLVEGIGGGFMAASGLKKYVIRVEVTEKGESTSIARTTIEYEIDESSGVSASSMNTLVRLSPLPRWLRSTYLMEEMKETEF
ncbi:hypothetical protein QJS04_geneDACA008854 [Acorus gramineus]|uniref:Bet v I/Major latex protein domain-containing protein n=1 Tax=Acorus gramineus TaxID=55184 RepID=A0AAV9ADC2_ACOGR|nr:hypothetical protein QJS04_geneDACA008854 [Acorus gramineus]